MRNAAMILSILGGILAAVVGFFGYGFAWVDQNYGSVTEPLREADMHFALGLDPVVLQVLSVAAPILAIAGGAMAPSRPAIAGVLLALATASLLYAFGFGFFTALPIAMIGLATVFALLGAVLPPKPAHH